MLVKEGLQHSSTRVTENYIKVDKEDYLKRTREIMKDWIQGYNRRYRKDFTNITN